jgi:hypothetical protein
MLPEDIARFSTLIRTRGLSEEQKSENREKIAGRIVLFHEIIARGLQNLCEEEMQRGRVIE